MASTITKDRTTTGEYLAKAAPRVQPVVAAPCVSAVGQLTVEHSLYAILVFVGGFARFAGLASWPLGISEAVSAWTAWLVTQHVDNLPVLLPESAALQGFLNLLFYLGMSQDFWVRFVPATIGTALVALAWWWRGFIGRWGALWLAVLLSIGPWLVAGGRIADGATLALAAFLLALTALVQVLVGQGERDTLALRRYRWSITAAASTGFLLATGALAWSLTPMLAAFVMVYRHQLRSRFVWNAGVLLAGLAALVLGATGGLLRLDGMQLVAGSLAVWGGRFTGLTDPAYAYLDGRYGLAWPLVRLLVDQPMLLIFGVGGLAHLGVKRGPSGAKWPGVLWIWLAWGVLLCMLPGRGPRDLIVLMLPLIFGTAHALASLWYAAPWQQERGEWIAVLSTLVVLTVSFTFWAAGLVAGREFDAVVAQASLVVFGLGLAMLLAYGFWASWTEAYWLGAVMLAAVLLASTISSAWQLGHRQDLTRPDGLLFELTHPDVRRLVQDIEALSSQRSGDPQQLAVIAEYAVPAQEGGSAGLFSRIMGPHPVLGWYLRNQRNVTWSPRAEVPTGTLPPPLIITTGGAQQTAGAEGTESIERVPEEYVGSAYELTAAWLPEELASQSIAPSDLPAGWDGFVARFRENWRTRLQPWLRWAVYRRVDIPPQTESVILWADPLQQDAR